MFKIGDKVKVGRAPGFLIGDKVEWVRKEIFDDECDNLSFVFLRPPSISHGMVGKVTDTIEADHETIGYVVLFDGFKVAVPTDYLSLATGDYMEPTTKMEVHKSTYEFLVEKFNGDQKSMVNYITELVSNNIPEPQKKSHGLDPEVFRQMAIDLGNIQFYDTKFFSWSISDYPIETLKKNMPYEYVVYFKEMFAPTQGERNYWWENVDWVITAKFVGGPSQFNNYIQRVTLSDPKSHLSQVIMALLFCAEMCED